MKRNHSNFTFNLWKNYLWILLGIFTITLAVWLEYAQRYFIVGQFPPVIPYHHLSDPYIPVLISIAGTFSMVVGIWNIEVFFAKAINVFLLEFTWAFMGIGDIERAFEVGKLSILGIVAFFVCVLTVVAYISPSMMAKILKQEGERSARLGKEVEKYKNKE